MQTPSTHPRLLISAVRKSSGKTMFSVGLGAALRQRVDTLRMYKKGPDYIDPMWHTLASGYPCHNLDTWLMGEAACLAALHAHSPPGALSLIEGNMGLHDGMELDGRHSSAHLATLLSAPVLLVLDASGMNRNIAAVVHGMMHFDPRVRVGGVVLNNVRGPRQEQKQREAITQLCGVPVLGALPRLDAPPVLERHLGLLTTEESAEAADVVAQMAALVKAHVDLDAVLTLAASAGALPTIPAGALPTIPAGALPEAPAGEAAEEDDAGGEPATAPRVRIAVARDAAFCFLYPDNLAALEAAGADLVYFSPMEDTVLPPADGLYLPGGFPESFLPELEANAALRQDIAARITGGLPTHAECGGMMYLARTISREGATHRMVGVIPGDVVFQRRPVGYGYVTLAPQDGEGWFSTPGDVRAHEFHYSRLENLPAGLRYRFRVTRGEGMGEQAGASGTPTRHDGLLLHNMLATYAHMHAAGVPRWALDFVRACRG